MEHDLSKSKEIILPLITVFLTVVLVAAGVAVCSRAFQNLESEAKYRNFLEHPDDIDVYFFGSSHMLYGVDPMQLWERYGITSYNFGNGGHPLPLTYWTFRMAVAQHVPKVAVLDVLGLSKADDEELPVGLAHDAWDAFPLNRVKYEAVTELFHDFGLRSEFIFPFSVYHNRWDEVTLGDFLPGREIRYNVDRGAGRISEIIPSEIMPVVESGRICDLDHPTKSMDYIVRFISDCRELGITPILVYIPFEAQPERQMEANTAELLSKSYNVLYENMLPMHIIDLETDSADLNSHVNISGMWKITEFLGNLLTEKDLAGDHRYDSAYTRWVDDYRTYRDVEVLERIRSTRNLNELLVQMIDDSLGVHIRINHSFGFDERQMALLHQIPHLFGIDTADPDDADPYCDLTVVVYDLTNNHEIDIQQYNMVGIRVGEYNMLMYPQ